MVRSLVRSALSKLPDVRHDGALFRRALRAGAIHGPEAFVRHSPAAFALAFALALPSARERARQNLERARGKVGPLTEAMDVARLFSSYAHSITEAFAVGGERGERVHATVDGEAAFLSASRMGRGLVVLTAHTSGWHAAGPVLSVLSPAKAILVMRKERDPEAEALQEQAAEAVGARVLRLGGQDPLAALPLLRHLCDGGIVAFQVDRLPEAMRGQRVRFLGREVELPEGPFRLAALSGAPIVIVLARRTGFLRYALTCAGPLVLPRRPSSEEIAAAAQRVATVVEDYVRAHPTDWFDFA